MFWFYLLKPDINFLNCHTGNRQFAKRTSVSFAPSTLSVRSTCTSSSSPKAITAKYSKSFKRWAIVSSQGSNTFTVLLVFHKDSLDIFVRTFIVNFKIVLSFYIRCKIDTFCFLLNNFINKISITQWSSGAEKAIKVGRDSLAVLFHVAHNGDKRFFLHLN